MAAPAAMQRETVGLVVVAVRSLQVRAGRLGLVLLPAGDDSLPEDRH